MRFLLLLFLTSLQVFAAETVSIIQSRVQNPKQETFLRLRKIQDKPVLYEVQECRISNKSQCETVGRFLDEQDIKVFTERPLNFLTEIQRMPAEFFEFSGVVQKTKKPKFLSPNLTIAQIKDAIVKKLPRRAVPPRPKPKPAEGDE
jgi:hypothetical protein